MKCRREEAENWKKLTWFTENLRKTPVERGEKTYYEILGIASNATNEEIKKAYVELARKHHPDKKPGDRENENKFSEITEAYRTLSRADSRYAYDLELGLSPGTETAPVYERLEQAPITGSAAGDYVETIAGGIPVPILWKADEETYEFKGLDNPKIRECYEKGLFSIGSLEKTDMLHYQELGMQFLREKKFDKAVAYCIEAVRMNPGNMSFRFSLGCCFEAKDFIKEAIEEYEQTLRLAENKKYKCLPVREALISLYMKFKMFEDVKKQCKQIWDMGLNSSVAERALRTVRAEEKHSEQ